MITQDSLVSIIMPCYNARKTLPLALASLFCQTYEKWECILVDDGSTDRPQEVIDRANDPRIKYFRLERNMGRGAARQAALDRASGDLLCMLDADDWLYPSKIQRQVEVMEREPKLALVSTGMAIVNAQNDIVGVRSRGPHGQEPVICGPFARLAPPPVAHAPSMMRMETAKQSKYDQSFKLAEDEDFLLRVLMDRYYCVLPDLTYVYTEHASITEDKILRALHNSQQTFWKYRDRFPVASRVNMRKAAVKSIVYRGAFAVGLGRWIIERRSQKPTVEDVHGFKLARQSVCTVARRLFGNSSERC